MKHAAAFLAVSLCLLCMAAPLRAELYSYVDEKGIRHYTNAPSDPHYKADAAMTARVKSANATRKDPKPGELRANSAYPGPMSNEDRLLHTIASKGRSRQARQMYDLFYYAPKKGVYYNYGYTSRYDSTRYSGAGSRYAPSRYNTIRYTYPATSPEINQYIQMAARVHRVDPMLIKAVIKAESNFNPYALSPKGAQGLMQLMPGTARDMRVHNAFDARQNIFGGARYLRLMLNQFNGDIPLTLAAYNAGPKRVSPYGRIPNIPETQAYVATVLRHYRAYRGGAEGKSPGIAGAWAKTASPPQGQINNIPKSASTPRTAQGLLIKKGNAPIELPYNKGLVITRPGAGKSGPKNGLISTKKVAQNTPGNGTPKRTNGNNAINVNDMVTVQ